QRMWIGMFNILMDTVAGGVVQETTDFGASWQSVGFPFVRQVWMIKFDTGSSTLAVATDEGVFITTVSGSVTEREYDRLSIRGIPMILTTTVHLPEAGTLELVDALGRVRYRKDVSQPEDVLLRRDQFSSGSYL